MLSDITSMMLNNNHINSEVQLKATPRTLQRIDDGYVPSAIRRMTQPPGATFDESSITSPAALPSHHHRSSVQRSPRSVLSPRGVRMKSIPSKRLETPKAAATTTAENEIKIFEEMKQQQSPRKQRVVKLSFSSRTKHHKPPRNPLIVKVTFTTQLQQLPRQQDTILRPEPLYPYGGKAPVWGMFKGSGKDLDSCRGLPGFDQLVNTNNANVSFLVLITLSEKLRIERYVQKVTKCILKTMDECYQHQLPITVAVASDTPRAMQQLHWLQLDQTMQQWDHAIGCIPTESPRENYEKYAVHTFQSIVDITKSLKHLSQPTTAAAIRSIRENLQIAIAALPMQPSNVIVISDGDEWPYVTKDVLRKQISAEEAEGEKSELLAAISAWGTYREQQCHLKLHFVSVGCRL